MKIINKFDEKKKIKFEIIFFTYKETNSCKILYIFGIKVLKDYPEDYIQLDSALKAAFLVKEVKLF